MKAPILNFDVQLMLQTKQVKLSQGLNSTSLLLQTWPILVKESKSEKFSLSDQNDQEQDRFYHFLHHRVWYNMYDIGNPGTYWRPSCFSHSVSQRQSLNFSRQSCLKNTSHSRTELALKRPYNYDYNYIMSRRAATPSSGCGQIQNQPTHTKTSLAPEVQGLCDFENVNYCIKASK